MSKNAMAGAVTLCGVGLCVIGAALMMQSGNSAHAVGVMPSAVVAVAATTHAQAGPTVVWYGTASEQYRDTYGNLLLVPVLVRAWSNGLVEAKRFKTMLDFTFEACSSVSGQCVSMWFTINDPNSGYRAAADVNADELVNGIDLASVLDSWGDAPRVPIPPSDCPLNLINP